MIIMMVDVRVRVRVRVSVIARARVRWTAALVVLFFFFFKSAHAPFVLSTCSATANDSTPATASESSINY